MFFPMESFTADKLEGSDSFDCELSSPGFDDRFVDVVYVHLGLYDRSSNHIPDAPISLVRGN